MPVTSGIQHDKKKWFNVQTECWRYSVTKHLTVFPILKVLLPDPASKKK